MISPEIPLLTPGMSVKQGLATMQMSGLSSLPIVDEGSYVGVVHEKELLRDDVAGRSGAKTGVLRLFGKRAICSMSSINLLNTPTIYFRW